MVLASTTAEILTEIGRPNSEQTAPEYSSRNSDFTHVRSRTNSKPVRHRADVLTAEVGGRRSKLRRMVTGVQLSPSFCTGGLEVEKIVVLAESGALWCARYIVHSAYFPRMLLMSGPTTNICKQVNAECSLQLVMDRRTSLPRMLSLIHI